MAQNYFRVMIPVNADKLVKLAKTIRQKHQEDGDASLLKIIDIDDFIAKVEAAAKRNVETMELRLASEKATQDRNKMLGIARDQFSSTTGTILSYVKTIRDILLGVHKGSEQSLGDWGFVVNSSPRLKPTDDEAAGD